MHVKLSKEFVWKHLWQSWPHEPLSSRHNYSVYFWLSVWLGAGGFSPVAASNYHLWHLNKTRNLWREEGWCLSGLVTMETNNLPGPKASKKRRARSKSVKRLGPKLSPLQERLKDTEFYTKPIIEQFDSLPTVKVIVLVIIFSINWVWKRNIAGKTVARKWNSVWRYHWYYSGLATPA